MNAEINKDPTKKTIKLRGLELLNSSEFNKGTAFTLEERLAFRLEGLLPPLVETIDAQHKRVLKQLGDKTTNLERYIYLIQLLDTNETLFYRVIMSDPVHFLPIIYAPTVGEACLKFNHIYRRPRGIYISLKDKGKIRDVLANWSEKDVRVACVTSGGRILGLGDLGANGMGIVIGKLQLYTACAGVNPDGLLPVLMDFGTDNRELLNESHYLGLHQKRPNRDEVDQFVDEFVDAIHDQFKDCCIHFEDWKGIDAIYYLKRYRDKVCCFNDDIQGTGSVTVAGLYSAMRIVNQALKDQVIFFFGAGSAGIGMADMICSAMKLEGLTEEQAYKRIWMFDINGLLENTRYDLIPEQKPYTHNHSPTNNLVEAIKSIKPTVLIGVSTVGKSFDQQVIKTMSEINQRPIIFALSNPTEKAECNAEEAYKWSNGSAIYAAGVQFPSVQYEDKIFLPGQANNFYIFPAIGFAIYATHAKQVTDEMFIEAAKTLAEQLTDEQIKRGLLFPPQNNILEIEVQTAVRIATLVFDRNLAGVNRPSDINSWLHSMIYKPEYESYI